MDPTRIATGLTAVSLINVATVFALPLLSVPAILGGVAVNRGLARAAWLGVGAFILLVAAGAALLLANGPIVWAGRLFQRVRNAVLRKRPPLTGFDERLTRARDVVRATLGERWGQAILRSAGNVLFDYLALLAALVAAGARPRASLVLLAYVSAVVLGLIPITPGGLGFVEAGLAATLVLAGVPAAQATLATLAYRIGVVLVADRDRPDRVCPLSATRAALGPGSERGGSRLTEVHRMGDHEGMQLRALAAAVRDRRLSAHELVAESLRRIEARTPTWGRSLPSAADEALEDARGLDAAIAAAPRLVCSRGCRSW
jgi:hypothetical protein